MDKMEAMSKSEYRIELRKLYNKALVDGEISLALEILDRIRVDKALRVP